MSHSDEPSHEAFLNRVFSAKTPQESRDLYDQWAKSYDAEMAEHEFTAPRLVAEALHKHLNNSTSTSQQADLKILDAGCGSGAVGIELQRLGFPTIDGLDYSPGMLDVARKTGVYRELKVADLTKPLEDSDASYDGLTCCGTFTHGHLGPEPLREMVRVVRKGGVLVATVLDSFWDQDGFEKVVGELEKESKVEVLGKESVAYRKDAGGGRVLILRRL